MGDDEAKVWRDCAQMLAASNAKLCGVALAADEMAEAILAYLGCHESREPLRRAELRKAFETYRIAKIGE